jgi:dipeptidyl aminopeptidase/acylaminoacyl peptidase
MTMSEGERYRRARRFTEEEVRARVSDVALVPTWLDGDRFWFERRGRHPATVLVDCEAGTSVEVDDPPTTPEPPGRPDGLTAPDRRQELFRDRGDLVVRHLASGLQGALTIDAEPWWDYAGTPDTALTGVTLRRSGAPTPPVALWSSDSTRIVTHRIDQRRVPSRYLLESAPPGGPGPVLHEARVPFPGDSERPLADLVIFDITTGERTEIEGGPLPVEFYSPLELGRVWWGAGDTSVWFLAEDRGARRLALCRADAGTGAVHELIVESSPYYVETHPLLPWPSAVHLSPGDRWVVWPSERDGWRHLYLYDGSSGQLLRQLTGGTWFVRDVLRVDDQWVWFTGLGREQGRDPYFRHLYRVSLEGGEPELLTPEDADHASALAPSGRFVIDSASTIATAPIHRLRRTDGSHVLDLGVADLSGLEADGWRPPERFEVTAADGRTPLHGALFFPSDFDPSARYPLIDSIYPGPQLIRTPKSFTVDATAGPDEWPGAWDAQALAELGLVVMTLDGRGTPLRSREQHLASYGHLGRHALDDHVAAIEALARTRAWLDGERVGITGHSAGGAAAVRAVIEYPHVFKVAMSGSGVHDVRRYLAYWAEKYQGLPPDADYEEASNIELAHRVQGPILLIHGELDDNVHPANTLALADALIQADKDFELVILPGQNHNCATHPYYLRRTWEFFVRHLLESPPSS